MYNRYIHNDNGTFTRIQEEDAFSYPKEPSPESPPPVRGSDQESPQGPRQETAQGSSSRSAELPSLRRLLDQLHLGSIDSGDLLLLGLLFFLFKEGADEELLLALGLLLIL